MQRITIAIVFVMALSLSACGDGGCADEVCTYTGACGTAEDWTKACIRECDWKLACNRFDPDDPAGEHSKCIDYCERSPEESCDWEGTIRIVDYGFNDCSNRAL